MAIFTINSREHGTINFFMPSSGGYVFLGDSAMGQQICRGGRMMGSTISATPDDFEDVCRKWHRQHLAAVRAEGGEY